MNILFLMDPLESVIMEKDTSFIFMVGAHRKGHNVFYLPDGGITRREGKTYFNVTRVTPQRNAAEPFILQGNVTLEEHDVDCIFVRSDPPFDSAYLMNTWLLDLVSPTVPIINKPSGIRTVNEKIWATQFTDLVPPTCVSRQKKDLDAFLSVYKHTIVKPTDQFGGKSIFQLRQDDPNKNVILETITAHFTKEAIMQVYVPEAKNGDKRILLLNGDPLGAVLRLHNDEDHRNNFFAGGKPVPAELTPRDLDIIHALKPRLVELGLYFVGIDVIGDYLIEVNVTSPTCLQEINQLTNERLEDRVIAFAEKLVDQHKSDTKIEMR